MPQGGNRSGLAFWLGGAAKPPSGGSQGCVFNLLAFWMGGAGLPSRPAFPLGPPIEGGIPFAKHHEGRPVNDDAEILEFLQIWTAWMGEE